MTPVIENQSKENAEKMEEKHPLTPDENDAPKTPPISPTRREQHEICKIACAPSDAHLSEFEEDEDDEDFVYRHFPYSSGSSPVSSFRMAIHQTRAPSNCGKFNQSLLSGLTDTERIKSSLCVCNSIRQTKNDAMEEEEAADESQPKSAERFPTKNLPVTEQYKISHEIIGIGESGKVMACYNKRSGEKFALKVLRDSARSRREIELHWLACRHTNVVSIMDIFENTFDGLNCMLVVVEFMQGGDLLTLFEANGRNPYSEKCVARIVRQIGSAVQFLHSRNIAHRDIKLENILCSLSDVNICTFKLADFGFAKSSEPDRLMNSPCCTPAYVCPEILSYKEYDKGCDIWALGVATYILLCGYPPFYSMQGFPFSPGMRNRITNGIFAFPAEDWDCVSASTKHMIRLMLRTEPSERITIQQLMASDFLRIDPPPKPTAPQKIINPLPPVPSDSSLSSDAGFESTDSKDSGFGYECSSHQQQNGGCCGDPPANLAKSDNDQQMTRAQFFLGAGTKSNSARQLCGGVCRPILRERVYSIQEQVDKALAFMRLGGGGGGFCVLKNPTKGPTGSKLLERRRSSGVGKMPVAAAQKAEKQ